MKNSGAASFLDQLNKEQLNAVKTKSGAILVLAGAGSGKTKVLTSRIANLVHEGASPYSILALTFTNKAAKEMQGRLSSYLGEDTVRRMWVGTFHNICGRILRRHLDKYKTKDGRAWSNNYIIYDETDTKTVIKNAVKKLNLDEKIYDVKLLKTVISNAKNQMQDAYTFSTHARDYKTEKYAEIYTEYEKQLALNNAIDFDDMLLFAVNILDENPQVREEYSARFSHILVDEFQDTNNAQYKLIRMLFNDAKAKDGSSSILVVGDVDQSIYSWRGADFRIILGFQKDYKGAKLIKLEQNYRSTQNILDAANKVIENNEDRISKNLYCTTGAGDKIQIYEAQDDRLEAGYIARMVRLLNEDCIINYKDMVVLYRTNAQSRNIEEAFMSQGLPYKIVGGLKFYDRKEIKDIISYLKFVYNTNDNASFKRIINTPKRGIGDSTVKKILELADENTISAYDVIKNIQNFDDFSPRHKGLLEGFTAMIEDFIHKQGEMSLSEFVTYILQNSRYLDELKEEDTIENQSRIENLQEFINVVSEFENDEFSFVDSEDLTVLGTFLTQVALVSDVDSFSEEEKAVTLMTLHSAKGLEFPVVFLVGLEEGLFPHSRAVYDLSAKSELEEERRLMYVGITRAKKRLYLTYAKRRMFWGDIKTFPKSRFLDEIPQNLTAFEGDENTLTYVKTSFVKSIRQHDIKKPSNTNLASSLNTVRNASNAPVSSSGLASSLKNIAASNNLEPNLAKNTKISAKKQASQPKKEADIKDIIEKCKKSAQAKNITPNYKIYPAGTRVFHSYFGVGHIKAVEGDTYSVQFTKHGVKSIDTSTSALKIF